jgi:hypothetical protein
MIFFINFTIFIPYFIKILLSKILINLSQGRYYNLFLKKSRKHQFFAYTPIFSLKNKQIIKINTYFIS